MDRFEYVAKGMNLDICDPHPIKKMSFKPRNIVQLISIKMTGGYQFARQTSFNRTMERHFVYGLNGARCNKVTETKKVYPRFINLPVAPVKTTTRQVDKNANQDRSNWVQIVMSDIVGMQAGLVSEQCMLWSQHKIPGAPVNSNQYIHQFYQMNLNNLEFTVMTSEETNGMTIQRKMLEYRDQVSNQPIKIMMMLTDQNQLLSFDMLNRKKANDICLSTDNELAEKYSYDNFDFVEEEEIFIVMGKEKYCDIQCILLFNYPPTISLVSVIHTSHLGMEFAYHNPYCLMYQESRDLIVSSWQSFYEQTIRIPPTRFNPTPLVQLDQELRINDLPTSNINMYLQTPNVDVININPTMIYKYVFDGIQFFTLTPSNEEAELPKYQFRGLDGQLGDGNSKIITFPDQSSRIVVTNPWIFQDAVVTFDSNGNGHRSTVSLFHQSTSTIDSKRTIEQKYCVMSLAYCEKTNLLAVLFCKNHSFHVKLYHPNSLDVVKVFPTIKRNCAYRFKIQLFDQICMVLEPEMLLVEFIFNTDAINPIREIYVCGLIM